MQRAVPQPLLRIRILRVLPQAAQKPLSAAPPKGKVTSTVLAREVSHILHLCICVYIADKRTAVLVHQLHTYHCQGGHLEGLEHGHACRGQQSEAMRRE